MATKPGTYELKVSAADYVADKQTVEVREEDSSTQRDFALARGIPTTIEAVWSSGARVVNAAVLEGVATDGHNPERMYSIDATGHVALRLRRGETRTLAPRSTRRSRPRLRYSSRGASGSFQMNFE